MLNTSLRLHDKKIVRKGFSFLIILFLFVSSKGFAQCSVSGTKNWSSGYNSSCTVLNPSLNAVLNIDVNETLVSLTINSAGGFILRVKSGKTLTISGSMSTSGGITYDIESGGKLVIGGAFSSYGDHIFMGLGEINIGGGIATTNANCGPNGCPRIIAPGGCSSTSTSFCANVNACGTPGGSNVSGCGSVTLTATGARTGENYKWYNVASGGTAFKTDGNTLTTSTTRTVYVAVYASSPACESTTRKAMTATVNATPTVTVPSNMSVCNGATINANFSSSVGGSTISWSNNNTAIGLASSGTGNISGLRVSNSTNSAITATITVTATKNGCGGSSSFTITVDPVNTWSGAVDSRWELSGNWCGGVPSSSHNVVIPAGTPNMPVITTVARCRNLTVNAEASLTIGDGSLTSGGTTTLNGTIDLNSPSSVATFTGDFIYNGTWSSNASASVLFNAEAKFLKAIESSSDFTINGSLIFPSSGKITMKDGAMLKMGQNATYTNADEDSYVIGRMEKTVTSTAKFIFPIGKDTLYRPLAIEPEFAITNTFEAEYYIGNPIKKTASDESGIPVVSQVEYWDLKRVSGGNARVTLYWGESSKVSESGDLSFLKVAHYNSVGFWENKGGIDVAGTWRKGSVTTQNYQTDFSPFTIASSTLIHTLPVQYLSFDVKQINTTAILTWETAEETNNRGFEVQRSLDGFQSFETVGFVSSSETQDYSFTDENQ